MAYDEGMGLIVPGQGFTKIAANGQGDLQKALGRTTCYSEIQLIGDVDANGNRVGATNKWAKFKSFQYSGVFTDSGPGSSRETAMRAANFGLSVPTFTYSNLISKFNKPAAQVLIDDVRWIYTPPVSYYRAEDFHGYVSRCDAWQLGKSTETVLYGPFGLTLTLPSTEIGTDDIITMSLFKDNIDYLVHLDEFQNLTYTLSDWYIGLFFAPTDGSSNYALYSTGEKPSATDWQYFQIPINLTSNKYYHIVPVLIQSPSSTGAGYTGTSGQICTFDDAYLPNIRKVATSNNLIVSLTKTVTSAGRVSGSLKIINNTGARINVQNLFLYLEAEQIVDGMESYGQEYHNKIIDTKNAWVGSSHTRETSGIMGNGSDSSKIIARYLNVSSSAFYVGVGPSNAVTKTFDFGSSATADGLGHTYNEYCLIYTQMSYTPDAGSAVYRTF